MDRSMATEFRPRDFIETSEGFIFAVVDAQLDEGRLTAYLRYLRVDDQLLKLSTQQAKAHLAEIDSDYVFFSRSRDTWVQAVPVSHISAHHVPRAKLAEILKQEKRDATSEKLRRWCGWLAERDVPIDQLGVTGSLLIGAQNSESDLDVVCYDRGLFQRLRRLVAEFQEQNLLQPLTHAQWQATYERRSPALSFEAYHWHERRKNTKALLDSTRLDLSLVSPLRIRQADAKKVGRVTIQAKVTCDHAGFDFPSRWQVEHESVDEIVCFSATYSGQVFQGEWVEAAGALEKLGEQKFQLVVGANREATGEFIRCMDERRGPLRTPSM